MPVIDTKELHAEFPENRIVLLNGRELVCYPKAEALSDVIDDSLKLDTTGQYLSVGKNTNVKKTEKESDKTIFTNNAFYFYRHIERIFSDSRMFLAPVPIQSGMAYSGTSGFRNPTLGVYLEWWLNCEVDMTKDKNGKDALTYHLAGSPLSGCNHCTCVYPDGTTMDISHYPFRSVWSMFMKVNNRYTMAKATYEAYSLEEVLRILKETEESKESELASRLLIEEAHMNALVRQFNRLKEAYKALDDKYKELSVLFHKKELDEFQTEYLSRKESVRLEIESLDEQRAVCRKQMKQGTITNVEYQHIIAPLTRKKKDLEFQLASFKMERMNQLVSSGYITHDAIERYLG